MVADSQVYILRELGRIRLDPLSLSQRIKKDGFVVFEAGYVHQLKLAQAAAEILTHAGITVAYGETDSPSTCMCLVDVSRHVLDDVREIAAQADRNSWEAGFSELKWMEHIKEPSREDPRDS